MRVVFHLGLILLLSSNYCFSQKKNLNDGMPHSKWWMGVKGGMNFTRIHASNKYSVFQAGSPSDLTVYEKSYGKTSKNAGVDLGITISYHIIHQVSLSFQPSYSHLEFDYSNKYQWTDSTGFGTALQFSHQQKLNYLELPLIVKISHTFGRITPYAQLGGFYGTLLYARKITDGKEISLSSAGNQETKKFQETFNLTESLISSFMGITAGAGASVDVNYFRLGLEFNYKYGTNNLVNVNKRYDDNRLTSGVYDVSDDLKIHNFGFYVHVSTPLDFLIHVPGGNIGGNPKPNKRRNK